jgi:hypothetical protein
MGKASLRLSMALKIHWECERRGTYDLENDPHMNLAWSIFLGVYG